MKTKIFYTLFTVLSFIIIISGCKKDNTLQHTQVSAVANLFSPTDNQFIKLQPATGTAVFEWEEARAEDNGLVMYEVVFDKTTGNFSKPIYSVPSDGNGLYNKLTITYKDLNKIANNAGIQPADTGSIKWAVVSSKGINPQAPKVWRTLQIQRAPGFVDIPADLYLTGSATEGGDDATKSVHFKQTSTGVFEVYTSLKAGTYHLADRNAATTTTFSVQGTAVQSGGTTTVTGDTKVYRINIDMNTATATLTQIESVGLWFAADNKVWYTLPYVGNSAWEIDNAPVVFHQESWGRDERYKFEFMVKDASGNETSEWWGSKNSDNSRPDGNSAASYWYMYPVDNSQYNYCFKFNGAADNHNCNIKVDYNPDIPAYTHTVTVK